MREMLTLFRVVARTRLSLLVRPGWRGRLVEVGLPVWWPVLRDEERTKVLCLYLSPGGRWSLEIHASDQDPESEEEVSFGLVDWRRALVAYRQTGEHGRYGHGTRNNREGGERR